MQVWDGTDALEQKWTTALIIMVISIVTVTVVTVVVNAVGTLKLLEQKQAPMIIVEAVIMVIQEWNIAKTV